MLIYPINACFMKQQSSIHKTNISTKFRNKTRKNDKNL